MRLKMTFPYLERIGSHWLDPFESVGDNCEFGFVQRALGATSSSLLRWALLDGIAATASGIRTSFEDAFAFENLRPAGGGAMVRDVTAGVAFHTAMRSARFGDDWSFIASEEERRRIHAQESLKLKHLRQKFDRDIAGSHRIYVAKRNEGMTEADAATLFEAIATRGGGRLLYVTQAVEGHPPGSVELVHARMAHGWLDRFAPYSRADDVSLVHWKALLRAALLVFETGAGSTRRLRRFLPRF